MWDYIHDIVASSDPLVTPSPSPTWREYSIRQVAVNKSMVPTSMHAVVKILTVSDFVVELYIKFICPLL